MDFDALNANKTTIPFSVADPTFQGAAIWLGFAALITLFSLVIFELLRTSEWGSKILFTRNITHKSDTPPIPSQWAVAAWYTDETYLIAHVGLDAVQFLRFLKMCLALSAIFSLITIPILVPTNYYASSLMSENAMSKFSISNVPEQSHALYLHVLFTYITSGLVFIFLYLSYKSFAVLSQQYLKEDGILANKNTPMRSGEMVQARTIMVENIPLDKRSDEKLKEWFEMLDIGMVETAILDRIAGNRVKDLMDYRKRNLSKLERLYHRFSENIDNHMKPKKRFFLRGLFNHHSYHASDSNIDCQNLVLSEEVVKSLRPKRKIDLLRKSPLDIEFDVPETDDAIDYYSEKLRAITQTVKEQRYLATETLDTSRNTKLCLSTGFVTFEAQRSAVIAAQTSLHSFNDSDQFKISMASAPQDVVWNNMPEARKRLQSILVTVVSVLICFFMIIPSAAIASLVDLQHLTFIFGNDAFLIFKVIGPSVVINFTNMNIIPYLLECLRTYSAVEMATMDKYFIYLFLNVFFVFTLTASFDIVTQLVQNPVAIILDISKTLPLGATYFINFIILNLTSFPLLIIRPFALIFSGIGKYFVKTPRELHELHVYTSYINYGILYPINVLVFVIVCCYSVLAPLITIPGTMYFMLGWICYKYQLLFVIVKDYDAYGQHWIMAFNRVCFGLAVSQTTFAGILFTKRATTQAILVLPLIPVTFIFYAYCHKNFRRGTLYIPLDQLKSHRVIAIPTAQATPLKTFEPIGNSLRSRNLLPSRSKSTFGSMHLQITIANNPNEIRGPVTPYLQGVIASAEEHTNQLRQSCYLNPTFSTPLTRPWIPINLSKLIQMGILQFKPIKGEDVLPISMKREAYDAAQSSGDDRIVDIDDASESRDCAALCK